MLPGWPPDRVHLQAMLLFEELLIDIFPLCALHNAQIFCHGANIVLNAYFNKTDEDKTLP